MAAGVPTVPRLFLGEALKRLRATSGKTLDDTAAVIGKSRARLINVLDGKGTLTADELGQLLDFLGADPAQKHDLLALGVEARKRPTRRSYTDLAPGSYARIADLELIATEIRHYERGVIPGLLQTPEYVEAIIGDGDGIWWDPSWQERHNRITFRLERQKMIMEADPAKTLRFVITDDALRTQVGSAETMGRQLEYLLSLMERPNINVRVLSSTAAHNPASTGGLMVFLFGASHAVGFLPVTYGPSTYLDDPEDIRRLLRAYSALEDLAKPEAESRQIIADLAKGT